MLHVAGQDALSQVGCNANQENTREIKIFYYLANHRFRRTTAIRIIKSKVAISFSLERDAALGGWWLLTLDALVHGTLTSERWNGVPKVHQVCACPSTHSSPSWAPEVQKLKLVSNFSAMILSLRHITTVCFWRFQKTSLTINSYYHWCDF